MAFNRFRIALVSLALGCVLPTAGHAERTVVNCRLTNATKIVVSDLSSNTQSTTPVLVPDMITGFVQGKRGCVIVELQVTPAANDNNYVTVDARLDNQPNKNYLGIQNPSFASQVAYAATVRSYKFIWPNVGPGPHNVRLYFQSHKASDTVWLHYPMMIVNYVK